MEKTLSFANEQISNAMTIKLTDIPKEIPAFEEGIRRAPRREAKLSNADIKLALRNALRYIPEEYHEEGDGINHADALALDCRERAVGDYHHRNGDRH